MSLIQKYSIELLAPARDAEVAIAAINHGADAVYIGATTHGARAAAANSVSSIGAVCEQAHRFDARVYVTVNTIVYESEIRRVEALVGELYRAGVDALIVQDLSLLRMDLPPIALHASTQCDIRTPERARFLQDLGFSQLVLPRELTLDEIRKMRRAVTVPLEAFVHGALCVSYSGDCRASLMCGGRSANRGECAQICRLPFDLTDENGTAVIRRKHLLSLRDLNRIDALGEMIEAGVSSLKIEGRLKDIAYVKNVVSAYDSALRRLGVKRTSRGSVDRTFTPDLSRSFNRGYTTHFLRTSKPTAGSLANFESPKSLGNEIGRVKSIRGCHIEVAGLKQPLNNGDGLNFSADGQTIGFRINRFEPPSTVITAESVDRLRPGTILRRNFDKKFADSLAPISTARRTLPLNLILRRSASLIILEEADGSAATLYLPEPQDARTPQPEARRRVLSKLGDTVYRLDSLDDRLGNEFVAASTLTTLRRELIVAVEAGRKARFCRPLRSPEKADATWPEGTSLTFHSNVANSLSREVYRSHGVTETIAPAAEVQTPDKKTMTVMTTRYCLRRELGACLKEANARRLPAALFLRSESLPPLALKFDCSNCVMNVELNLQSQ